MRKNLSFVLLMFAAVLFIVSCSKDKTVPVDNTTPASHTTSSLSGFGAHGGSPSGTAFVLPSNVHQIGEIYGGLPGKSFTGSKTHSNWMQYIAGLPKSNYVTHGIGEFVNLYMKLHNTSPNPTTFVFPAGLVFCNKSADDSTAIDTAQSGIIVMPDTVTIPGGDTLELQLKSFCTNLNHHAPSSASLYCYKVITNNDQMVAFLGALKGKTSLPAHVSELQSYVWKITNNTGLTQDDFNTIASWQ